MDSSELQMPSLEDSWRFETKYRIPLSDASKIRSCLMRYFNLDEHSKKNKHHQYLVRSLYFDTYDYQIYEEKMSGDSERAKFRIRSYKDHCSEEDRLRVELKVRYGNAMSKYSTWVSTSEYRDFLATKHWERKSDPVLNEFERCMFAEELYPQVLVRYQRIGFKDKFGDGIRITFDYDVKGSHASSLFPSKKVFWRELNTQMVVMEIKCRNQYPVWLKNIIREYGLRWVANSKFAQAIQVGRHDLCFPNGVVVVR